MLTARFLSQASVSADGTKADYVHHTVSWGLASMNLRPSNNKAHWCMIILITCIVFFFSSKHHHCIFFTSFKLGVALIPTSHIESNNAVRLWWTCHYSSSRSCTLRLTRSYTPLRYDFTWWFCASTSSISRYKIHYNPVTNCFLLEFGKMVIAQLKCQLYSYRQC